jgi:hypothetical protein
MPAPIPREFVADTFFFFNFSACKTRLSAPLAILQGTEQSVICMVFQNSVCLLVTKLSKQKSFKTITTKMFAIYDKAKPNTEHI